jgi:hypothetical protein
MTNWLLLIVPTVFVGGFLTWVMMMGGKLQAQMDEQAERDAGIDRSVDTH